MRSELFRMIFCRSRSKASISTIVAPVACHFNKVLADHSERLYVSKEILDAATLAIALKSALMKAPPRFVR